MTKIPILVFFALSQLIYDPHFDAHVTVYQRNSWLYGIISRGVSMDGFYGLDLL